MSITRGGEKLRKQFDWRFDAILNRVLITNEDGREHMFTLQEIQSILETIQEQFGAGFFPLANNVVKLTNGTERLGLGKVILEHEGSDVDHAQGSSYLGVVLEESGYFEWNGRHHGIEWKLRVADLDLDTIAMRLSSVGKAR
jgi:hypothetical protein